MKIKIYFATLLLSIFTLLLQVSGQTINNAPDSIFIKETFGTGTTKIALPAGRTTYAFNGTTSLNDGDYMVYNRTNGRPEWHNAPDHTGDINGRAMVINAGYAAGEFYKDTVYNLTGGVTYSVYLYVMNTNTLGTCGSGALLPKLQFVVEYYNQSTSGYTQLTSVTTAFIPQSASPLWQAVGSTFVLPAGVTTVRYRILNSSNGGCGNDLAIDDITFARAISIPSTLPVTGLQAFAQRTGNTVTVQWETLAEYNTSIYVVEKSNDAVNWHNTDTVTAAGYSQVKRIYTSTDLTPGSLNYYRIKQVDNNGRYSYSNTVRISFTPNAVTAKTYPNPFVSQVQVDVNSELNQRVNITFTDISGRKLLLKTWALTKGNNSMVLPQVVQFPAGMYMMNICTEDGTNLYKTKLVKN